MNTNSSVLPLTRLARDNPIQQHIETALNEFAPREQRFHAVHFLKNLPRDIETRGARVPGDLLHAIERVRGLREEFGESWFQEIYSPLAARMAQRTPSHHRVLRNYFSSIAEDRATPFLSPLPERTKASPAFGERVHMVAKEVYEDSTYSEYATQVVANRILSMEPRLGYQDEQAIREAFAGNLRDFRLLENQGKIDQQMRKAKSLAQEGLEKEGKGARSVEYAIMRRQRKPPVKLEIKGVLENGAGVAHAQGDRPAMEDTHVIGQVSYSRGDATHTADVYAIFDGHNGRAAADFAQKNLVRYLEHHLPRQNHPALLEKGNIFNALKLAMVDLSEACKNLQEGGGTTAAIAIKMNGKLYVVNVGDSRILINSSKQGLIQATEDAEPTDERFWGSLEKRGGELDKGRLVTIKRDEGRLGVARVLGDGNVPGVTARPKITCFDLEELGKSQVIIGCDGIFEVESSKTVLERANQLRRQGEKIADIAAVLVKAAYDSASEDNLSVMVIPISEIYDDI